MKLMKKSSAFLLACLFPLYTLAGPPQWTWEAGDQTNNGAIVVKQVTGGGTYNATQNPTGGAALVNQNAATQAPTVVLQSTATLLIAVRGAVCNSALNTIAITASRAMLLTCPATNIWTADLSQGNLVSDTSVSLTATSKLLGGGSQTTYGATTVIGAKNAYSGLNFQTVAGTSAGTLMMSPAASGFYNAADTGWRWFTDNIGDTTQAGYNQSSVFRPALTAVSGASCAGYSQGDIAKAATGKTLSCQAGLWGASSASGYPALNSGLPGSFCSGTTNCGAGSGRQALCYAPPSCAFGICGPDVTYVTLGVWLNAFVGYQPSCPNGVQFLN